jgi:hypothetical protein
MTAGDRLLIGGEALVEVDSFADAGIQPVGIQKAPEGENRARGSWMEHHTCVPSVLQPMTINRSPSSTRPVETAPLGWMVSMTVLRVMRRHSVAPEAEGPISAANSMTACIGAGMVESSGGKTG